MTHLDIYKPATRPSVGHSAAPVDMKRCRATVNTSGTSRYSIFAQCSKAAKVEREGFGFCGSHDPVALRAKSEARDAAYKADMARRNAIEDTRRELLRAALNLADGSGSVEAVKEAAEAYRKVRP